MSEKIKSEMISRRGAFSLLGLAAALSLVVPATMLTATEAEAQRCGDGSAVSERRESASGATSGPAL